MNSSSSYEYWKLPGKDVDTTIKIRVPATSEVKFVFGSKTPNKDSIFSKYYLVPLGGILNEEIVY